MKLSAFIIKVDFEIFKQLKIFILTSSFLRKIICKMTKRPIDYCIFDEH